MNEPLAESWQQEPDTPAAPEASLRGPLGCRQPRLAQPCIPCLALPCRGRNLAPSTRHHGRVPEVDDQQLAALRRLRRPSAPSRWSRSSVISNHPGDDLAAPQGEPIKGARMADPRRMTPAEQG